MSKHTPEPWRVGRDGAVVSDTPVPLMRGSDAIEYYGGNLIGESITEPNARRIVACVNACAGMSNDELEGGLLLGAMEKRIAELEQQRNELLEAMENLIDEEAPGYHDCTDAGYSECGWCAARKAIAKVKEGSA